MSGRECGRGWSKRCASAKGKTCRCACGGENHGNPAARKDNAGYESLPTTPSRILYYGLDEERVVPTEADVLAADDRRIKFVRVVDPQPGLFGAELKSARVYLIDAEGESQLPRRYVKHSPTGFEWGYGGSGPADTALNVLALIVPVKEASRFYQDFKFEFIARIDQDAGGEFQLADVRRWLAAKYAAEKVTA